jgi:hypothetical protein
VHNTFYGDSRVDIPIPQTFGLIIAEQNVKVVVPLNTLRREWAVWFLDVIHLALLLTAYSNSVTF